jgi:hypothetical protein
MPLMNAAASHPAIAKINAKIEEFHELESDFKNDKTLELAKSALEGAKITLTAAEAEDDSIGPEELVDRRIEARRQVEIAEIRLSRAQKSVESQGCVVRTPLLEAGEIAAEALRGVVEPFAERLEYELRKLIGEEDYNHNAGHFKSIIYRKGERLYGHARQMESAVSIPGLIRAISLLEEATRLD